MSILSIQEHVPLAPFTTIGVGGPARFFAHVQTEEELEEAVSFHRHHKLPLSVLGGGSNLLVHDEGFPGLVLHLDLKGDVQFSPPGDRVRCIVPAGTPWDTFVLTTCELGLRGVECLAGIPGLTGGTPVQNVGAYGQEVSQTIKTVRVFDLESQVFLELTADECQFSYRGSRFNSKDGSKFVVCAVTFELGIAGPSAFTYKELRDRLPAGSLHPREVYDVVREIRAGKGMLLSPDDPNSRSAGSFFKNPLVSEECFSKIAASAGGSSMIPHWTVPSSQLPDTHQIKVAAAWLVQMAGFAKGFVDGRAGISSKHSLALINRGGATFADIARLRDRIEAKVEERFGIKLEQEPVELGPRGTE